MSGTPCGFIGDGYERDIAIKEEEGVHPELHATIRPMIGTERGRALHALDASSIVRSLEASIPFVLKHLVKWDLKDHHGELVIINEDNLQRVEPHLFVKLRDEIYNLGPENKLAMEKASGN